MPRRIDKTAVFLPYYPAEYRAEDENAGKSPENPFFDRYKTNRSKFNHTAAARDISEGREKSYVWMLRVQSCARCGGNGMLKTVWKSEKKTRAQTEGIDVLIYLRIKSVWWGRGDTRRISNKERRTWNKPFVPLFHRVCQSRRIFFLLLLNLEIDGIRIVKDILILYRLLLSMYIRFVTLFAKKQVKHYLISIRCM